MSSGLIQLKEIVEETSQYTGREFFDSLVIHLSKTLGVDGAWVTEYDDLRQELNAVSFYFEKKLVNDFRYSVPDTPCEQVINNKELCHIPDKVIEIFPRGKLLHDLNAVSYVGIPLLGITGSVMGHLSVLDKKPMPEIPDSIAIIKIFASRATAEMRRLHTERLLRDSETKLSRLINGAQEAIIEFDDKLNIQQVNESCQKFFNLKEKDLTGHSIGNLFHEESGSKLLNTVDFLRAGREHAFSSWIQGHLICKVGEERSVPAEASISSYLCDEKRFFSLFLYNVNDKLAAQEQLARVSLEASMLREKLTEYTLPGMIAECPAMKKVVELIHHVGPTKSSVLITGETGTGKELVAQAIHHNSLLAEKTLVTVNCAALPTELIESELFGHVKGAFTGAFTERAGRFLLADKSTLFLDEVGELPLSVQAKLLRVLQEGEFQPLGSSETIRVNVRIVAATHRDLGREVEKGNFREDLYYRLNVFPIHLPPLRERGDDIIKITERLIEVISKRNGIQVPVIDEQNLQIIRNYKWPGNVRELQNVLERAVILSQSHPFDLGIVPDPRPSSAGLDEIPSSHIYSEEQMKALEKRNIENALKQCNWKVSGKNGAARLLNIPVTTLNSRISKYGIEKRS